MSSAPLPDAWRDLYVMLGTSSAALIGLLFVAASLHLAEIVNEDLYRLRAQYTTLALVSTLIMATAILTPQPMWALGAELLIATLGSLSLPLILLGKVAKIRGAQGRGGYSIRRAASFIVGGVIGVMGAAAVAFGDERGMYLVTASFALCLVASIWTAWMIMIGIGRAESSKRH
jgi:hypothetical protein